MSWALPIALAAACASTPPSDAVFALVMVDRFADGNINLPDVVPGHPRRFQGGDVPGLQARLVHLKSLGVTHVWLTPLARQVPGLVGEKHEATAAYHGYWPVDLTGIDPHFGTPDDVRALLAEAERLGMKVILDVVTNHFGYHAPDPLSLVRPSCGTTETEMCLFGLPDLMTEDPRVRAVVVDRALAWVKEYPFAGFRLDAFKHVDADVFRTIGAAAKRLRPGFFTIAEHWGASPGDPVVSQIVDGRGADAVLDFSLQGLARDWVGGRLRTAAFVHHLVERDRALAFEKPMLAFLDNHDVETWAHAAGVAAPLGAALLLADRAIPVITWGTEIGRLGGANDPENRTMMDWSEVARAERDPASPLHAWRAMIQQRRAHSVLRSGALRVLAHDAGANVSRYAVFERSDRTTTAVVALARVNPLHYVGPVSATTRVVSVAGTHGGSAAVDGGMLRIAVPGDGFVSVVLDDTPAPGP